MSIGISILAYGDEHIKECLVLISSLKEYDLQFYIVTDKPNLFNDIPNTKIIPTNEPFNYNLKRYGLKQALENNDCVVMMDTDMYIKKGVDFTSLENINDGLYIRWRNVVNKKTTLSSEVEYDYIDKIKEISNIQELFFIDESTLVFKTKNKDIKKNIIQYWNQFYNDTLEIQPKYRNNGAVEGLLIYVSCLLSGLNVFENKEMFQQMIHYRHETIKESK
jgi:hypothetical protein